MKLSFCQFAAGLYSAFRSCNAELLNLSGTLNALHIVINYLHIVQNLSELVNPLGQCFANWVLRNPIVPRKGVRDSKIRKCVMAEEFIWPSKICMNECKFVWRYSTLIIPSLRIVAFGIYFKQIRHGMYHFDFLT